MSTADPIAQAAARLSSSHPGGFTSHELLNAAGLEHTALAQAKAAAALRALGYSLRRNPYARNATWALRVNHPEE